MPPDFPNETTERLVNIEPDFRWRFNKLATKMSGKITSLWEDCYWPVKIEKAWTYHLHQPVAHIPSRTYSRR